MTDIADIANKLNGRSLLLLATSLLLVVPGAAVIALFNLDLFKEMNALSLVLLSLAVETPVILLLFLPLLGMLMRLDDYKRRPLQDGGTSPHAALVLTYDLFFTGCIYFFWLTLTYLIHGSLRQFIVEVLVTSVVIATVLNIYFVQGQRAFKNKSK